MLTLPTRDFVLVLDPQCLERLLVSPLDGTLTLISDLAALAAPISIRLVLPAYLATEDQLNLVHTRVPPIVSFNNEGEVPALALSRGLRRRVRERIERGAEGDCRALRLLALAELVKADGVVTDIASLIMFRYDLLRHQRFRVIPAEELSDFVEVCGRGHDVPCTAAPATPTYLPWGALYQFTHWKGRRLRTWLNKVAPTLSTDQRLQRLLQTALVDRYAFILRARDMVRFYGLQADHHIRRGQKAQTFREPLNYHLTAFYTHVWGMLDALAQIANRRVGLGVNSFRCHITRDDFLHALDQKHPGLQRFIREYGRKWVAVIGDVRHPVAHSALRLQQDLLVETEESKKSDDEIAAILREEDPELYEVLPPDLIKEFEPVAISNWRLDKMNVISDDVIYVEEAQGGYFRSPIASIDFDVERVNAFIDAFLVACFGTLPTDERRGSEPQPCSGPEQITFIEH